MKRERLYSRNGFKLICLPVAEFNQLLLSGGMPERKISSKIYLCYNGNGELRKSGWVAFTYDCVVFGMTKEGAIRRYGKFFPNDLVV